MEEWAGLSGASQDWGFGLFADGEEGAFQATRARPEHRALELASVDSGKQALEARLLEAAGCSLTRTGALGSVGWMGQGTLLMARSFILAADGINRGANIETCLDFKDQL